MLPFSTAKVSAVWLSTSFAFTFAPFSMSSWTIFSSPVNEWIKKKLSVLHTHLHFCFDVSSNFRNEQNVLKINGKCALNLDELEFNMFVQYTLNIIISKTKRHCYSKNIASLYTFSKNPCQFFFQIIPSWTVLLLLFTFISSKY